MQIRVGVGESMTISLHHICGVLNFLRFFVICFYNGRGGSMCCVYSPTKFPDNGDL